MIFRTQSGIIARCLLLDTYCVVVLARHLYETGHWCYAHLVVWTIMSQLMFLLLWTREGGLGEIICVYPSCLFGKLCPNYEHTSLLGWFMSRSCIFVCGL